MVTYKKTLVLEYKYINKSKGSHIKLKILEEKMQY